MWDCRVHLAQAGRLVVLSMHAMIAIVTSIFCGRNWSKEDVVNFPVLGWCTIYAVQGNEGSPLYDIHCYPGSSLTEQECRNKQNVFPISKQDGCSNHVQNGLGKQQRQSIKNRWGSWQKWVILTLQVSIWVLWCINSRSDWVQVIRDDNNKSVSALHGGSSSIYLKRGSAVQLWF